MVVGTVVILTESNNINFSTNNKVNEKDGKTQQSKYEVTEDIDGEEF